MTKHATSRRSLLSGEAEKQQLHLQSQHNKDAQLQAALAPTARSSKGLSHQLWLMKRRGSKPSELEGCKKHWFSFAKLFVYEGLSCSRHYEVSMEGDSPEPATEEQDGEVGLRGEKSERRKGNSGGNKLFS